MTNKPVKWVQAGLSDAPAWGSAALAALTYPSARSRNRRLEFLEGAGVIAAQLEAVLREWRKTAVLFCTILRIAEETAQEERRRAWAALVVAGAHSYSDQVVDELLVLRRAVEQLDDPFPSRRTNRRFSASSAAISISRRRFSSISPWRSSPAATTPHQPTRMSCRESAGHRPGSDERR